MKLCISNNVTNDSSILGDNFTEFDKVIEWLNKLNTDYTNKDFYFEPSTIENYNSIVRDDLAMIYEKYKLNKNGTPIFSLNHTIKVPIKKSELISIKFIQNAFDTNINIIRNKGKLYFDFYNYNCFIDILFGCFRILANDYDTDIIFKEFSIIYESNYTDSNNITHFNSSITSLINDKILETDEKSFYLSNKGKRIFSAIGGKIYNDDTI